jgi:excisionase family DNA binding protein
MPSVNEDVYLTTADALAYLRTAPRTLYRYLASGQIPAVRIGRQWRFRKADLDRWVASRVEQPLSKQIEQETPAPAEGGPRVRRVLVADDDEPIRDLLTRIFAAVEYEMEAVPDGMSALARLRTLPFDLLVTDLRMPGMGGLELAREARRVWPAIKIVVITGYPSQSSAIDAVNIGVDAYLTKPFRSIDLLMAVARAFEQESSPAASAPEGAPASRREMEARS